MASAGDIHSILYRGADVLKQPEPKYDARKKVTRHFPGKIPEYARVDDDDEDIFPVSNDETYSQKDVPKTQEMQKVTSLERAPETSIQDRRLERLNSILKYNSNDKDYISQGTRNANESISDKANHSDISVTRRKRERAVVEFVANKNHNESKLSSKEDVLNTKEMHASSNTAERLSNESTISKRLLAAPVIISTVSEEVVCGEPGGDVLNEDSYETARDILRRKALELRRKEEEELSMISRISEQIDGRETIDNEQTYDYSSSDEDDSDKSDTDMNAIRPLFIPAAQRESLRKQELFEAEQDKLTREKENHLEERKAESKKMLIETIVQDEEEERQRLEASAKGSWHIDSKPDDNDDINEEAEYELWKIREMKRLIRDRTENEQRQELAAEIERRRNMTDAERAVDDCRLDSQYPKVDKGSKYSFMQKYYHKGVFFQDKAISGEEPLYLRDFNIPVGDDRVDKKSLPQPMRLRRGLFGKAGQVKHTHLADVDTTDFTSAWSQRNRSQTKIQSLMAGIKGATQLDRPSVKKKAS